MRQGFTDRRQTTRFEVFGHLALTVFTSEPLRLLNVGSSGALVESSVPLASGSTHGMRLAVDADVADLTARVRRVVSVRGAAGIMHLIALEFLSPSADAQALIGRLLAAGGAAS